MVLGYRSRKYLILVSMFFGSLSVYQWNLIILARYIGEVGDIRICGAILIDFILLLVNNSYKASNQIRNLFQLTWSVS